jgi:hypothetical protein
MLMGSSKPTAQRSHQRHARQAQAQGLDGISGNGMVGMPNLMVAAVGDREAKGGFV